MYKEERFYDNDGKKVMVRTSKLRDKFDEERGFLMYYNGRTVNGLADIPFPETMSKTDIANIAILSRKLVVHSNFLGYRSGGVLKPMGIKQIAKAIGTEERQTHRFIKKMTETGMVAKVTIDTEGSKRVLYLVNPLYFMNGRNINDLLYWAFQEQLDYYMPEWAKERYGERKRSDESESSKSEGTPAT